MSDTTIAESFVHAVLAGHAFPEDIDDWIDNWHDAPEPADGRGVELHTFLGMTWPEYALWVEQPDSLRFIIAAHHQGRPVEELMVSRSDYALAARSQAPGEANKVLAWLKETGRIDPEQASQA